MIDIIIYAYNAHDTIEKTLYSIGLQANNNTLNVYIVNDGSKKDYKKICDKFSKIFNIKELKLKENKGSGFAKQYGFNHSKGKYIIFLDSGDILYDLYTTSNLFYEIEYDNLDICVGSTYFDSYKYFSTNMHDLHSKIFRRSFIEENNIKFLNIKSDEDIIFSYMAKLCTDNIKIINLPVCVCNCKNHFILENNFYVKDLKSFVKNSYKLVAFIKKNSIDFKKGAISLANILMILYYNNIYDIELSLIKHFYKIGKEFFDLISEDEWIKIYNNYYAEKIPKISFSDFIQLIS